MLFRELNRGTCKTYLIGCENTHKAALVDPVRGKVERYLAMLVYYGCQLVFHTGAFQRCGPDQRYCLRLTLPWRLNPMPSSSSNQRCSSARTTSPRRLIPPAALITRCQGTVRERGWGK